MAIDGLVSLLGFRTHAIRAIRLSIYAVGTIHWWNRFFILTKQNDLISLLLD